MKRFLRNNTEIAIVIISIAIFALLKLAFANKFALLNLFYIPVFISGYYLGKKPAIQTGLLGILMAVFFAVRWPTELLEHHDQLYLALNLVLWGSFLMLGTILISSVNENRERRVAVATGELLEQYLRRAIEGKDNHPARVAQLVRAMARETHLPADIVASLEAAALLHDLKESKNGLKLIEGAMSKGLSENKKLGDALPIILAGETGNAPPRSSGLTVGAKMLSLADEFDTISTRLPDVEPLLLLNDLERENRHDHAVILILRRLIQRRYNEFSPT